jgi:hypothetical protein
VGVTDQSPGAPPLVGNETTADAPSCTDGRRSSEDMEAALKELGNCSKADASGFRELKMWNNKTRKTVMYDFLLHMMGLSAGEMDVYEAYIAEKAAAAGNSSSVSSPADED